MKLQEQFLKMLDALPCGVGIYKESPELIELYYNDAFFKLIGYSRQEYAALKNRPAESYIAPEDRKIYGENVLKMREQGFISGCEYRVVRKDQTLRWVQLDISRIILEGETVYFASFTDVTRTKESELANAYADDRFRLVLENTNTAVFEWSSQTGNYYSSELFQNYALSSIHAINAFKKAAYSAAVHPDDLNVFSKFFDEIKLCKEKVECVLRLKMIHGSYRWSRLVCVRIAKEKTDNFRVVGAILDINDEMEKAAIHEELLKAIPGGVAVFKIADKPECLYYNDTLSLWNRRLNDGLQKTLKSGNLLDAIAREDRERFEQEVLQRAKKGLPINITYRYIQIHDAAHSQLEWMHLSATRIREDNGCPIYYAIMTGV